MEQLNKDVSKLIAYLRSSRAPAEAVSQASEHINKALETLQPHLIEGEGWSAVSIADDRSGLGWSDEDITVCMPYSPISGRLNAIALPLSLRKDGDVVRGEVTFSPTYAGPPNSVHGGIISAVFDELLAMANVITGRAGFTGTLTIRYHRKTPLNTAVELWGKNELNTGRKQISKAEMRVDGKVTASAQGLFICADEIGQAPPPQ